MTNKERYLDILSHLLWEHYNEIKLKKHVSEDRKQYITGYMAAARALNVLDYEELKEIIDKMHFKTMGKTIEERRKSESGKSSLNDEFLEVPTYIREGISLKKK